MNKNPIEIIIYWGIIVLCISVTISCSMLFDYSESVEESQKCTVYGESVVEDDLAGSWVTGDSKHLDTLIINSNGTYKQIIHIDFVEGSSINYESDWQPWYVEYSDDNIAYLHLVDYSFCGMNPDISCERRDGGGYDFCKEERISMEGEGKLIVLKTPDENFIYIHYPLGLENSYAYGLTTQ